MVTQPQEPPSPFGSPQKHITDCNGAQLQKVLTTPKAKLESLHVVSSPSSRFLVPRSCTIDSNRFIAALDGCLNLRILNLSQCALTLVQVQAIMTTAKVYLEEVDIKLVWKPTYSTSSAAWRVCREDDLNKAKEICRKTCKNAVVIQVSIYRRP